jgi:hypothetical protein
MKTWTPTLLLVVSFAYLGFLVVMEVAAWLTGDATISARLQEWTRDNTQLAIGLAAVAGWLIAHFSGPVTAMLRRR